ncbi:GtrA family protein [Trujillonella endophytica]|uniref:Putative flippase GtrA (Transmembrane translocase of bactoprenol-linked glucose) n=1 Tax=Trujillonella endophytica TaxID=673521 RepID=A0A1H8RUV1_9ACTN|nr:GtrA family protein [Trujillella endophytica]SEO70241.1 Putative flippase GtrA (transmembrane translocase of bactoprenol-linked glucose) [Trujillella endophytica]
MTGHPRGLLAQLVRFLLGSGLGLVVDLSVFAIAIAAGAPAWAANVLSAGCAVVVVYLFVTKYAFAHGRSRASFAMFVAWYALSIVVFSALIELTREGTGWPAFVCKLASLPPSFAANFVASRLLLRPRPADGPTGGDAVAPEPVGPALLADRDHAGAGGRRAVRQQEGM